MLDNLDSGKRLLLAAVVSLVFFMLYDYFYYSDVVKKNQQKIVEKLNKEQSPATPTQNTTASPSSASISSPSETQNSVSAPISAGDKDVIATVKISDGTFIIDSLGRIASARLNEVGRNERISLFNENYVKPLEVRFSDATVNSEAFKFTYSASVKDVDASTMKKSVVLTQKLKDITVTKEITFYPAGNYDLKISNTKNLDFFVTPGFRPDNEVDMMTVHGALIHEFDDTTAIIEDGDATGHESYRSAKLVSGFDRYYTTLFYDFTNPFDVFVNKVNEEEPLAFVSSKGGIVNIKGYIGPKNVNRMKSIEPQMISAVEYGVFTFLAAPLFVALDALNGLVGGNWGWTIIIFIIIVKIILFPLSHKGMVSMNKLKILSPKIKELQKKYKGEPQKLQVHMMELYKKHGANPMGGCLPFILQIPIFFAIYRVLVNAIELRGSEWAYIEDLSAMDPYYILPVLMGVSMFLQQRLAPSNFTDPMQEKMMKFLPVIFTFFFFTFPAGLVLYWFANNVLSIGQQYIVNKSMEKEKVVA